MAQVRELWLWVLAASSLTVHPGTEKIDHALDTPATACFDASDRKVGTGA
jgi:hypothetical protein